MRAAIVGCGGIAKIHALSLAAMDGVTLAGFADIILNRAEDFASQYGGRAYPSLEEMLDGEQIDVLHICTPHNLHVPMTVFAAERGIAVFSEKPPLIRHEEKAALFSIKTPVGFCFQNRYNPENLYLRERVLSPEAGAIKGARAFVTWSRDAAYYGDWHGKRATEGGGVVINQAVHTLDILVWLLGKPQRVSSSLRNVHLEGIIEVEDTAELYLEYPGKRAVFYATTAYTQDAPVLLEVHCENYTVRAEGKTVTTVWKNGRRETVTLPEQTVAGKSYWGASHAACIRDFYDCVENKRTFALSTSNIADTIGVLMEVYHGQ